MFLPASLLLNICLRYNTVFIDCLTETGGGRGMDSDVFIGGITPQKHVRNGKKVEKHYCPVCTALFLYKNADLTFCLCETVHTTPHKNAQNGE